MRYYLISAFLALGMGVLGYYLSANLYFGIGVGTLFAFCFGFLVVPLLKAFLNRQRKRHECYHFVQSFLISLSVSPSPEEAFDAATLGASGEEGAFLSSIQGLGVEGKLENLKAYFSESYYPMLVSLFRLYQEVGGEVISLAEPLLSEATRKESQGDARDKLRLRFLVQFIALWLMSGAVLVSVRVGLSGFYEELSTSLPYLMTAGIYFALAAFACCYFALTASAEKLSFGRRKNHEDIQQEERE